MITADSIVDAARAALGTPFRHQGRRAGHALDCAGLLVHVCAEVGVAAVDRSGYPRHPNGELVAALDDHVARGILAPVMPADVAAGDFVLMRFEGEPAPRHLGICAGKTLIHAWAIARKVCEHDFDAAWRRRVISAYRLNGICHGE